MLGSTKFDAHLQYRLSDLNPLLKRLQQLVADVERRVTLIENVRSFQGGAGFTSPAGVHRQTVASSEQLDKIRISIAALSRGSQDAKKGFNSSQYSTCLRHRVHRKCRTLAAVASFSTVASVLRFGCMLKTPCLISIQQPCRQTYKRRPPMVDTKTGTHESIEDNTPKHLPLSIVIAIFLYLSQPSFQRDVYGRGSQDSSTWLLLSSTFKGLMINFPSV